MWVRKFPRYSPAHYATMATPRGKPNLLRIPKAAPPMKTAPDSIVKNALSIRQLAALTGVSRDKIASTIMLHNIEAASVERGYRKYQIEAVVHALVTDLQKRQPNQFERRAYYAAESLKLKIGLDSGELMPRAQVERDYARAFMTMAQFIDTAPDILEREGCDQALVDRVEKCLDVERKALADRLRSF